MNFEIEHRLPSVKGFISLRSGVRWGTPTAAQAQDALAASLGGVVAVCDGEIIGMARAVGDGVLNVYIQDVIVMQAYQHGGIGQSLISALVDDLSKHCPPDCLIGLFAAEGQDGFYTQFGFTARPQSGFGPGMHGTLSELAKVKSGA